MSKIDNPIELATQAAEEYQACYADDLLSVCVFGSAAGVDFDPRRSDINLLIILETVSIEAVEKSAEIQDRWRKQRFARPIFMDREYINRSLDAFPIEFFNMQQCHAVVAGEDLLAHLEITRQDLKLQAERELRGKWLHLIQEGLEARSHRKQLRALLQVSLGDFTAICRALLHVRQTPVPQDRKTLWNAVTDVYELEENTFEKVSAAAERGDKREMRDVFPEYVRAVEILSEKVDQLPREEAT